MIVSYAAHDTLCLSRTGAGDENFATLSFSHTILPYLLYPLPFAACDSTGDKSPANSASGHNP